MNITLKEVPTELHDRLRLVAQESGRSLNKQILHTFEKAVSPQKESRSELMQRIRKRRDQMNEWIDDASLQNAISEGRQ